MKPITREEISDMIFVSKSMALAREIAQLDYTRIHGLLKEKDQPLGVLCPSSPSDTITPRLQIVLTLLAFAAEQLKMVMPDVESLKQSTSRLKEAMGPEARSNFDAIMESLNLDTK